MVKVLLLHSFIYSISCLVKQHMHNNILLLLYGTHNALHLPVFLLSLFSFFCQPYLKYWQIWSKKIFYHQIANAVQLFVPIKSNFFRVSFFFFRKSRNEGEFCRSYLINIATCLLANHENRHDIVVKHLSTQSRC